MKEKERKEKKKVHRTCTSSSKLLVNKGGGKDPHRKSKTNMKKIKEVQHTRLFFSMTFPFFLFVTNKKVGVGGGVGTVLIVI